LNNTTNNAGSDTAIHAGHYFFILFLRKIGKIFDFIERVRLNFDIKKGARCNENHVN